VIFAVEAAPGLGTGLLIGVGQRDLAEIRYALRGELFCGLVLYF
jgi:hypothetical protein